MAQPRLRSPPPPIALVIEVIDADTHGTWTAMASEWERIGLELRNAPVALSITIYEWHLLTPINPRPGFEDKYPKWKRVGARPWTLDRG